MALFIPSKKPATPASSAPTPHTYGHVTRREFDCDVLGQLRRDGLNKQERQIVESAAAGHMDSQGGLSSKGMSYREKEEFVEELRDGARELGLEAKDVERIDDALNRAL
ncbi:MAG: hypothetical protein WAT81_02975 [Candidatus Moraniibacteriota bacterium]